MFTSETDQPGIHELHTFLRRQERRARDVRALNNAALPPHELQKAANRIENDGSVVLLDGGTHVLLVQQKPFLLRRSEKAVARVIPGLRKEVVAFSHVTANGSPDYAGWLLHPGRVPASKLGAVTEAAVWEESDKKIANPVAQFASGVSYLAHEMARNIENEKDQTTAAWKYAIAYTSFDNLYGTTKAGFDCAATALMHGQDFISQYRDSWAESGCAVAEYAGTIAAIEDYVKEHHALPDASYMGGVIYVMRMNSHQNR